MKFTELTERAVDDIYSYFSGDMHISKGEFKSEVKRWRQKWSGMDGNVKQKTLVETLDHGKPQFYPGVYVAVITLITLPYEEIENALTKYHDRWEIELFSNFAHSQAQGH